MTYRVILSPTAREMLVRISDRRVRDKIRERIDGLSYEPDRQGKPLTGELAGHRSLRAVGQRYRILYRVAKDQVVVFVVTLGIRRAGSRKDIYELAKKLVRLRFFEGR